MAKHDFLTMTEMSINDQEIAVSPDVIACDKVKNGFKVTVGVSPTVGNWIINSMAKQMMGSDPDYITILVTVNRKQYEEQKKANSLFHYLGKPNL